MVIMPSLARISGLVLMVTCLVACGKVTFGPELSPSTDAGVAPDDLGVDADVGPDVPDLGPPDLGIDAGCVPVELPGFPMAWPFGQTASGYRKAFWEPVGQGCTGGSCHSSGNLPPYIPEEADIDANYQRAIMELWPLAQMAGRLSPGNAPEGRYWVHHPDYAPQPISPSFQGAVPAQLDGLLMQAHHCAIDSFYRSPPDAGPICGDKDDPPDMGTGNTSDGGDSDSGGPDAGMPEAGMMPPGPCACPLPDAGRLSLGNCMP